MAENLVGIEEAARFLSVKVSWLYEQVRLGKVPSYRIGKFRRFRISELEAYLQARRDGPNSSRPLEAETRGQA
jgi:excisionase family DNA binding protein